MTTVQILILETLVLHFQIVNNQIEVVTDSLEVSHFDLHLVDLLMQAGDVVFTRQDISLQLFDLIIKHELEFLKLLRLFLQLDDAEILVLNRGASRLQLGLLCLNLTLELVDGDIESAGLA